VPYDLHTLRLLEESLPPEAASLSPAELAVFLNTPYAYDPEEDDSDKPLRSRAELILGHGAFLESGDAEVVRQGITDAL
jgi:hypothetical protein